MGKYAVILFFIWIVGTIYAFWQFQFKNMGMFIKNGEYREDKMMEELKKDFAVHRRQLYAATIYHILEDDCSCTKNTMKHLESIKTQYGEQNVRNVRILQASDVDLSIINRDVIMASIPATPAVAILNGKGDLAYFGPYSSSMVCGTTGESYIEIILNALLSSGYIRVINLLEFGCYCPAKF